MNEITFNPNSRVPLELGKQYDHNETKVTFEGFDCDSANTVYFKLETSTNKWLIPLSNLAWTVTNPFTQTAGIFRGQLVEIASDNSLVNNSGIFKVHLNPSVYADEEYEVTDPTLDLWATQLTDLYNQLITARDDGTFKGEKGDKGDKGDKGATGSDGISPTVSLTKSDGVTTLSITDVDGTKTEKINDGANGETGSQGADGYSPSATVVKSGTTSTITITDKSGTTTATVNDGEKGEKGDTGEVDYSKLEAYRKSADQDTIDTEIKESLSDKLDKPSDTPTVGKVLKIKSVNEDGTFVCEWADDDNSVTDVKVNGTSVVSDGVANVPTTAWNRFGVVKVNDGYGTLNAGDGYLGLAQASETQINARTNKYCPVTSNNLVTAVDSVLCSTSTSEALSSEQQQNACERLGASSTQPYEEILRQTYTGTGEALTIEFDACSECEIYFCIAKGGTSATYSTYQLYDSDGNTNNTAKTELGTVTNATNNAFSMIDAHKNRNLRYSRFVLGASNSTYWCVRSSQIEAVIKDSKETLSNFAKIVTTEITGDLTVVIRGIKA